MPPPAVPIIHECSSVASQRNPTNPLNLDPQSQGAQKNRSEIRGKHGHVRHRVMGGSSAKPRFQYQFVPPHPDIPYPCKRLPYDQMCLASYWEVSPFSGLQSPCRFHGGYTLNVCERRSHRGLERGSTARRQSGRPCVPSACPRLREEVGFASTSVSFNCSAFVSVFDSRSCHTSSVWMIIPRPPSLQQPP